MEKKEKKELTKWRGELEQRKLQMEQFLGELDRKLESLNNVIENMQIRLKFLDDAAIQESTRQILANPLKIEIENKQKEIGSLEENVQRYQDYKIEIEVINDVLTKMDQIGIN